MPVAQDFNAELMRIFPSDYPRGLQIVPCDCDECNLLRVDFEGREWTTIDDSLIDRHCFDLPLFAPEAIRYFLPAFMRFAFATPSSTSTEVLVCSLMPSGMPKSVLTMFSSPQRHLIVTLLDRLGNVGAIDDRTWARARARWIST